MKRKRDISNFLIFLSLLLVFLPILLMFNNILTRLVEKVELYNWIQSVLVPTQIKIISMIVGPTGANIQLYPSSISINGVSLTVTWNCLGWQSMLLFIVSLIVSLKGSAFTMLSKMESILLGLFGTFFVNIFRMSFTVLLAAYSKPLYRIIFHDFLAAVVTIVWLLVFWWFAYKFVLDQRSTA